MPLAYRASARKLLDLDDADADMGQLLFDDSTWLLETKAAQGHYDALVAASFVSMLLFIFTSRQLAFLAKPRP